MRRLYTLIALIFALSLALNAEQVTVGPNQNEIRLLSGGGNAMELELTLGQFDTQPVQIDGATWQQISLKKEGLTLEAGYPQLPVMAGSLIIPNSAKMELSILDSDFVELQMPVAPSKGNLTRDIDPDSVPYSFADFYGGSGSYPAETAYLTEPFILRDYRGITVRFQPFAYFPATGTLRVYTRLRVGVNATGTDLTNSLSRAANGHAAEFEGIYRNMFLNFGDAKYPSLGETGRILVIKHSMFDATLQPWIEWKRQNGYQVDVVDVSVAGPAATQIKTYIQNEYNLANGLMFVQIVGDAAQVPTLTSGGGGSDPSFALLAGSDSYPEIYVGRFSATTTAELETQITRSIHYERDLAAGSDWVQKAMGVASNEGGGSQGDMGESDQVHMENIRTDLLAFDYLTVDQMYQNMGATAAQVSTNLNQGRGFINYVGHGSNTSWSTTGYSNTHVNALTNDYKLPLINSVACVNGNFVSYTCFAEAWMRSVNETTGAPAGAIGIYASSINQSWNPPMRAQDETVDLLGAMAKYTVGGLLYNGSSKMIEVYGTGGADMYKTWHIFGDASILFRTKDPQPLTATYNPVLLMGMTDFQIETVPGARVSLYANGTHYATGVVDPSGMLILPLSVIPAEPMDLTLTVTAYNKVTHIGVIQVLPANGPYLLIEDLVATDANNNLPEYGETVTLNVTMENVGSDAATAVSVAITTDDPYITVVQGTEVIPTINANATGGTVIGFQIQVGDNVPDQHEALFEIVATLTDQTIFSAERSIVLNAPAFSWGSVHIEDGSGNDNGRIDAGESVTLTFPITNVGHAPAGEIIGTLIIDGVMNIEEPILTDFTTLAVDEVAGMIYSVTFSSQIPMGTNVNLTAMLFSGNYSAVQNYTVGIGIVQENFAIDFTGFPWYFTGGSWTIDPAASYNGSNAARSAVIGNSQATSMTVTMTSDATGFVSFWKKVSCEQNYDYLKFYIDGMMRNQWTGTNDNWEQISYEILPGTHTYKWEYFKDSMTSAGSDCAWIDDIIFPSLGGTAGTPNIAVDAPTLEFGTVYIGESSILPLTVNNTGDAMLMGSVEVPAGFMACLPDCETAGTVFFTVPAQGSQVINVSFAPTQIMDYSGDIVITTDDPDQNVLTIPVIANGDNEPVSNTDPVSPAITELKGNWPNPFNPVTTISYSVKDASPVLIQVFNLKGQLVRTLVDAAKAPGDHKVVFDGLDDQNHRLSSGVYLFKMHSGKYTETKKMIMMK